MWILNPQGYSPYHKQFTLILSNANCSISTQLSRVDCLLYEVILYGLIS